MMSRGVAGIVTEGNCRDTDEVINAEVQRRMPRIGRPIIRDASNWSKSRSRSAAAALWFVRETSSAATGTAALSYP